MTKLFTYHDPYRIHAISGSITLLHFIYRTYCIIRYSEAFPSISNTTISQILNSKYMTFIHAGLYASAYIPHIPSKRNLQNPMIWPEFRIHNTIFGMRHILATCFPNIYFRIFLVFISMYSADLTTKHFGSIDQRTTNAMPYPKIDELDMQRTKKFYAVAQFHATALSVIGSETLTYYPLLALQMSPLLMTLVRKGMISCYTYHLVYSIALLSMYLIVLLNVKPAYITGFIAYKLRFNTKMNKYLIWTISLSFGLLIHFNEWMNFKYLYINQIYAIIYQLYSLKWLIKY
uniref:Uncharacterized protein n=1 Tax=viral metagenome TaxID=1070528 RepID=A0A6C0D0Y1_9ZZZZ